MTKDLLQRAPEAVEMTVDDTVIVVDPATNQMITLNAVAGLIWAALESPIDLEALVAICVTKFPAADPGQVQADVKAFVDAATELGVVFNPPS